MRTAARLVLGPGYPVVRPTSRGAPGQRRSRRTWRSAGGSTAPQPPRAELVETVSQAGEDGRRTRPGLALNVDLGDGRRLAVLNLHLKAGCRQGRLNESTSRSPERALRRESDCAILQRQVPAIEQWADEKLAARLRRDRRRRLQPRPAARDPRPAARRAPTAATRRCRPHPRASRAWSPNSATAARAAAWFALARATRYPKRVDCHRNIDNFLLEPQPRAVAHDAVRGSSRPWCCPSTSRCRSTGSGRATTVPTCCACRARATRATTDAGVAGAALT